jgi:cell division protein FtsQ
VTTAVSRSTLIARRQRFRRRLWLWRLLGLWRISLAVAFAGGLIWLGQRPLWQLSDPGEVRVAGNRDLTREQILAALELSLPEPLLQADPHRFERRLRAALPLRTARVSRQLYPPALSVRVEERQPVALAPQADRSGYLDETGVWIDSRHYRRLKPPALSVWGFARHKTELWRQIYPRIAASPVAIQVVDLRTLGDLVLRTELGEVRLGAYGPHFGAQLRQLDRMRSVATRYKPTDIAFIDLRSMQMPVVRLRSITP